MTLNGPVSGPKREVISGNIKATLNGIEGYICGNNMTAQTAGVICRQLNPKFKTGSPFTYIGSRLGSLPFLFSVSCDGNEKKIDDCKVTPLGEETGCTSSDYGGGVICSTDKKSAIKYRIYSDDFKSFKESFYGLAQVYYENNWGHICGNNWNYLSAKVFCQSLGFVDGSAELISKVK